jgi:hypothetical protein
MDDSLFGPTGSLPEPDQYPDTSFTQPLDEHEEEEDDYDDMDDLGEQYDLWTKQAEQKRPAQVAFTTTLGEPRARLADDEPATADRMTGAGPSRTRHKFGHHPLTKTLPKKSAAGAARSTTPVVIKKQSNPPTYNPLRHPAAPRTDPHPPLSPSTSTLLLYAKQAGGKKRARAPHDLAAATRHRQPGMPDDESEAGGPDDASVALDYADEQLRGMAYAELRDEPFDAPPKDGKQEGEKESVAARVEAGLTAEPEQQELAFNAMTLEEWEEAGEWFVGRFAETVRRMAEVRKRKRRVGREAEEAVARRNEAVEEGERGTKAVLDEMKERGGEILRRRG